MGTKHVTSEQKEKIISLYQRRTPTPEIAEKIGCSKQQVRHTVVKAGIPRHWEKTGACYKNRHTIHAMLMIGKSLSQIAEAIGTNRHRLSDYLSRHGIHHTRYQQAGKNNPAWNGGRSIDKDGYILLYMPSHPDANRHGQVREHRLVMEKILGRRLSPSEIVHHLDGDRSNNSPENLELFESNTAHLAQTLKGKIPKWTVRGRQKILECVRQKKGSRKKSSR